MPKHRLQSTHQSATDTSPIVKLWVARMVASMARNKELIKDLVSDHDLRMDDNIAVAVGLGDWIDKTDANFDRKKVLADLHKNQRQFECDFRNVQVPEVLRNNVDLLAKTLGLIDPEKRILEFAVMLRIEPVLEAASDLFGELSPKRFRQTLSTLLDISEDDVRSALRPDGILSRSGIVLYVCAFRERMNNWLVFMNDDFPDVLTSSLVQPATLLKTVVTPGLPASLKMDDFTHIQEHLQIILPFFKRSMESNRIGVNIYIHGAPGTGKTELARTLAAEIGCELHEVSCNDSAGEPITGESRLRAYKMAQHILGQRGALLVVDEAEDIFNDDGGEIFGRRSTAQSRKGWITRALEENPVPTIWLSNTIGSVDSAYIRRFDVVFELPVPPKKQRSKIIHAACADMLDAQQIARVAEAQNLAPAIVTRAASVARLIRDDLGPSGTAGAIQKLISSTLEAQGHAPLKKAAANQLPDSYDPAFIQADANLLQVATGLAQTKSGRLCLYGPPGTGKTAYGRWLADQLGVPLLVKRASDLMSMWVGGTEKNMAHAFDQAETDGSLLLIDEVDSFLQDRRSAQASWETSQVNEMLTQMESFSGIFIASTNLMSGLDQAALRRFDLKVKFDFLRSDQTQEMLIRQCARLNLGSPTWDHLSQIAKIKNLTPGDFAAVSRQHRFRSICSTGELIAALKAECQIKEKIAPEIGFLH